MCEREFFTTTVNTKRVGKQADAEKGFAFIALSALRSFLDENDECQYSVSVLMEHVETFLQGEKGYAIKYFKQRMTQRYDDDSIITNNPGKPALLVIVTLHTAQRVLHKQWVTDTTTRQN